jgi:hypothetical protein
MLSKLLEFSQWTNHHNQNICTKQLEGLWSNHLRQAMQGTNQIHSPIITANIGSLHECYLIEEKTSHRERQPVGTRYYCSMRADQLLAGGATSTLLCRLRLRDHLLPCHINWGQIYWLFLHNWSLDKSKWCVLVNLNQLCVQHLIIKYVPCANNFLKMPQNLVIDVLQQGIKITQSRTSKAKNN